MVPIEEPTTNSHYQRLGVTPAASTEEIRAAYRLLAGRLHPDRQTGATPAERSLAERRMREVNESWHVLGDPNRRRAYDAQRRGDAAHRSAAPRASSDSGAGESTETHRDLVRSRDEVDDDLVDVLPPMRAFTAGVFGFLPWAVLLLVLGLIFVVTAYAGGDDSAVSPRPPDAVVGDCLDVSPGPSTTVVPCSGEHEYRVVARVGSVSECPAGSEGRRFATDGMFDCLVVGGSGR